MYLGYVNQNNQNGYICEEVNVKSLEATIKKFIDKPTFFDRQKIAKEAKWRASKMTQIFMHKLSNNNL